MARKTKPSIAFGAAFVSLVALAGCSSAVPTVPAASAPPTEVIVEPEPTVTEPPAVAAPGDAGNLQLEDFRDVLVEGCLTQGGTAAYCTCTFDHFVSEANPADVEALLLGTATEEQQESLFSILEAAPAACVGADADVLAAFTWDSIQPDFMEGCTTDGSPEFCECAFSQLRDNSGITEGEAATVILGGGSLDLRARFGSSLQLAYLTCSQ